MSTKDKIIQIKPFGKKGESKVKITFSEELTIYTIEDIEDDLKKTIEKYNNIEIIGKDVKNMDLTFVQLIYSIKQICKNKNKNLECDFELDEENLALFKNNDLLRIIKK